MIILTNPVPSSPQTYILYSGDKIFNFPEWTEDVGGCGPFTYWIS